MSMNEDEMRALIRSMPFMGKRVTSVIRCMHKKGSGTCGAKLATITYAGRWLVDWTQEKGIVHYFDHPDPDSTKIIVLCRRHGRQAEFYGKD